VEVHTIAESIKGKMVELETQNRLLTENLVAAVWVMDAKSLMYEYITPSIYQISGYTSDELIGTSIIDRLTPESLQEATEMLAKEFKEYEKGRRVTKSLDLELLHKNSDSDFTHTICPDCKDVFYSDHK